MSYWISLEDKNGEDVEVSSFQAGGIQSVGGLTEATINITYNYSKHFNFRQLHDKKGSETVEILKSAVYKLGVEKDTDYYASTTGNAGYTCNLLFLWATQYPDCIWRVN